MDLDAEYENIVECNYSNEININNNLDVSTISSKIIFKKLSSVKKTFC